jgi:predicted amidophosphoribosyltransferase
VNPLDEMLDDANNDKFSNDCFCIDCDDVAEHDNGYCNDCFEGNCMQD